MTKPEILGLFERVLADVHLFPDVAKRSWFTINEVDGNEELRIAAEWPECDEPLYAVLVMLPGHDPNMLRHEVTELALMFGRMLKQKLGTP